MFYYASKILFAPFTPSTLLGLMIAGGLALSLSRQRQLSGLRLAVAGVTALVVAGFSPLGSWLILPLEERFARPGQDALAGAAGIIILGGFEDNAISTARGVLTTNEAGERIIEGAVLARKLPATRVVFSGGVATLFRDEPSGAPAIRDFLIAIGVEPERLVIEDRSRTTWENAVLTREQVRPRAGERWVLVTSAFHMPRSVGVFRQAGFDVIPWPVDYRTRGPMDVWRTFSRFPEGLDRIDVAAKEWIGLVAYRLSGRSSALWPAP